MSAKKFDTKKLRELYESGASISKIAHHFGSTYDSVASKLYQLGISKNGRGFIPENSPNVKLDRAVVVAILEDCIKGTTYKSISSKHGISAATISQIRSGNIWKFPGDNEIELLRERANAVPSNINKKKINLKELRAMYLAGASYEKMADHFAAKYSTIAWNISKLGIANRR